MLGGRDNDVFIGVPASTMSSKLIVSSRLKEAKVGEYVESEMKPSSTGAGDTERLKVDGGEAILAAPSDKLGRE